MSKDFRFASSLLTLFLLSYGGSALGQQKPQWVPGQMGLNAGILPSPGLTYANITLGYYANRFNDASGHAVSATGSYNVWAVENALYYVPNLKILGGNLGCNIILTPATGSLDADIVIPPLGGVNLSGAAGGGGLADLYVQPFTLGWHEKRVDFLIADGMMLPTGRYSPGATDNVGTGYFGNHLQTGTTAYITKNKATSVNLFTDWEVHGSKEGTNNTSKTPGQAFTDEWGLGQLLPLKKDFSRLAQVGLIGYDQWQVTANGGRVPVGPITVPASLLPFYSVHAVGVQTGFIMPAKLFTLNFKWEREYSANSHFIGSTFVFGGTWTFPIPKPAPPKS